MTKKERAAAIIERLNEEYPESVCTLEYQDPYHLLVSVRLAAQCTDARVNMVTPALFAKYPTPVEMAQADPADVEELIRSTGFFHTKARDLVIQANQLLERFDGKVPDNIDDLLTLQGVGRKTANLVCGDIYNMPGAVVTDTHLIRLANRMGLVDTKDPKKVEFALRKILPAEESNDFCHRCVLHGRAVCTARKAHCEKCCLDEVCLKHL